MVKMRKTKVARQRLLPHPQRDAPFTENNDAQQKFHTVEKSFLIPPPVQRRPTSNAPAAFLGRGCNLRRAVICPGLSEAGYRKSCSPTKHPPSSLCGLGVLARFDFLPSFLLDFFDPAADTAAAYILTTLALFCGGCAMRLLIVKG